MKNYENIWSEIQKKIKEKINNENFYNEFILNTNFSKKVDNTIVLQCPNEFSKKIIESNYLSEIKKSFFYFTNENNNVVITCQNEKYDINTSTNKNQEEKTTLLPNMDFSNYVVGDFNKKIFKAGKLIIENSSEYPLFFIYGLTGTGKTHFINSVGIEYVKLGKKVKYINAEDFVRSLYKIILESPSEIEKFKDSFDIYDLLIVDDIQFFANKEKINEIFFSIFNKLQKEKKNIILSSDKIPNELNIDKRMISRFNSGLVLHINTPDVNTIKEIIKYKIKNNSFKNIFTSNAIDFIANRFNTDIRILDGVLKRIKFHLDISEDETVVNEEKIKEIFEKEFSDNYQSHDFKINPEIIISNICSLYGVSKEEVVSKNKSKQISFVRNICVYILRKKNNLSYTKIGSYFSNRDHSTIMDSYKKISELLKKDLDLKKFIDNYLKKV